MNAVRFWTTLCGAVVAWAGIGLIHLPAQSQSTPLVGGPQPAVYPVAWLPAAPAAFAPTGVPLSSEEEVIHEHFPLEGWETATVPGGMWRARSDYLYIHRDVSDYFILSRRLLDDIGPVAISRDSFEFEPENGIRVAVERRVGQRDSIEGVVFGVEDWDFLHARLDPSNLLFSEYRLPNGDPVPGFDEAFVHEVEFTSDFYNFELNWWHPLRRKVLKMFDVSLMLGLRYAMLDEEFYYRGRARQYKLTPTLAVIQAESFTKTENDIYAFQLGWMVTAPLSSNWILRWDGKVATGVNFVSQYTRLYETFTPTIHDELVRNDAAAVIGDSLVTLTWQINCNLAVYVGYQVVFMEGVALATEQFNPVFSIYRTPRLNHNGFVFMQAAVGGVELTW